jgi:hypothetical protein
MRQEVVLAARWCYRLHMISPISSCLLVSVQRFTDLPYPSLTVGELLSFKNRSGVISVAR